MRRQTRTKPSRWSRSLVNSRTKRTGGSEWEAKDKVPAHYSHCNKRFCRLPARRFLEGWSFRTPQIDFRSRPFTYDLYMSLATTFSNIGSAFVIGSIEPFNDRMVSGTPAKQITTDRAANPTVRPQCKNSHLAAKHFNGVSWVECMSVRQAQQRGRMPSEQSQLFLAAFDVEKSAWLGLFERKAVQFGSVVNVCIRPTVQAAANVSGRPCRCTRPPVTVAVKHCSRMFRVRAYPRESQEMVFDAHDKAFAFRGGACQRGIYDNMKTAVDCDLRRPRAPL